MLGKDYNPMEAMNVSYLIENQTLHIVVADSEKNIRLLQYAPFRKSIDPTTGAALSPQNFTNGESSYSTVF